VGTPKSKIQQHEKKWLDLPWRKVTDSVEVKLFKQDGELYVLAKSEGRQQKEIAIRRKRLARLLRKPRAMRQPLACSITAFSLPMRSDRAHAVAPEGQSKWPRRASGNVEFQARPQDASDWPATEGQEEERERSRIRPAHGVVSHYRH
jgi:hypothetical protein